VAHRRFSTSQSAGRRGEVAEGEGGGGFIGSGAAPRSFRVVLGFRALYFSFTASRAVCSKYPTRWAAILRVLDFFYRALYFRVLYFCASDGALLSDADALKSWFLPRGCDLARLLEML
jgi:hypothetical protein